MTEQHCRLKILAFTALLMSLMATVVHGQGGESDKKRREPAAVPAIEANGLRYEAVLFGTPFGYDQDGGIVAARDNSTGRLEWTQRIYAVADDHSIEADKQDVFISALELSPNGQQLLITNERGARFTIQLSDRSVKKISEPQP